MASDSTDGVVNLPLTDDLDTLRASSYRRSLTTPVRLGRMLPAGETLPGEAVLARARAESATAARRSRIILREWGLFLGLVAPNLLLLAAFTYWPLIYNAYLSLVDWDMLAPDKTFIGLDNYKDLASDVQFWRIVRN